MYLYIHAYGEKKTYLCIGFQNAARSCKVGQNINILYTCTRVYSNRHRFKMYICASPPPSHGQVFGGMVPHKFPGGSSRSALPCEPQRSHVCYFTGKSVIFEGREAQATRKSHNRALFPAQYHHIGLYGPTCNSKHEAGGPASAGAATQRCISIHRDFASVQPLKNSANRQQ